MSAGTCDHGPSCCKMCRDEITKLRVELNLLQVKLQGSGEGKKGAGFTVPGLEGSDSEYDSIQRCLEVIEINTEGQPTRFKVKEDILNALSPHNKDRPCVARRLTDLLFTKVERTTSNVQGLKGKKQLDRQRMAAVKDGTFRVCEAAKTDQPALWKECVRSIDAASRGLGRDRSKKATKRLRDMASSPSNTASGQLIPASEVTDVLPVTIMTSQFIPVSMSAGASGHQIPVSLSAGASGHQIPVSMLAGHQIPMSLSTGSGQPIPASMSAATTSVVQPIPVSISTGALGQPISASVVQPIPVSGTNKVRIRDVSDGAPPAKTIALSVQPPTITTSLPSTFQINQH